MHIDDNANKVDIETCVDMATARRVGWRILDIQPIATDEDARFYVYGLFREDGSLRYVGKGTGWRMNSHGSVGPKHKNPYLAADFIAGLTVKAIKIIDNLCEDDALAVESALICEFGIECDGLGQLSNLTYGGESAKKSEETKRKVSAALMGKKLSDEHKAKLRIARARRVISEETKIKISQSLIGNKRQKWTPERRAQASIDRKGKKASAETKAKLSAMRKGRIFSEEHKAKISAAKIGKTHTEETKAKLRDINTGKKHTDETKAKVAATSRGRRHSPETIAKMRQSGIERGVSDKCRAAQKEARAKLKAMA